jgi:DNA anti-recombination protein RmuC
MFFRDWSTVMASRTSENTLGIDVLKRERALASEKLKDMKTVFNELKKLMDAASVLNSELAKFTNKYGMNKQAIDELFELSSQQISLIRQAAASDLSSENAKEKSSNEETNSQVASQNAISVAPVFEHNDE